MQNVISFIMILFMMIATFFNGFSPVASDLLPTGTDTGTVLSAEDIVLLDDIVESETAWLASLQLENGAIPMTAAKDGVVTVNPYFADFAALALLDKAEEYSDNVKAYMEWHFSHLNSAEDDHNRIDGTIYDYNLTLECTKVVKEEIAVKDGKNSYDSTDSYAATFLMVLDKYYQKTGDTEFILANSADIARITDVIFATLNMGLTYAKPDYKVKYLMDNCEVYEGVISAFNLFREVICKESSDYNLMLTKCRYAKDWIGQTIESALWNSEAGHYEAGIFNDGSAAFEFSWDEYYPCAAAQLFPVIHGVIPADCERAQMLYDKFCSKYNWESFDIPDNFYWGSNVYAAVVMNDTESALTYMANYEPLTDAHAYPLYNADAAKVSMAAYKLLENADS